MRIIKIIGQCDLYNIEESINNDIKNLSGKMVHMSFEERESYGKYIQYTLYIQTREHSPDSFSGSPK